MPAGAVPSGPDTAGPDTLAPPTVELDVLEGYRRELTGYCYRMLGSGFEADDAVQETIVRAWRAADRFEGRSSVRSWVYRIATNVCLDMLRGSQRRARPMELGPSQPSSIDIATVATLPEHAWVSPIADDRVLPVDADPAEITAARESIRLAFVAALQHLPARQRAALILCEVLKWQATEAAELLDTSVASVNSALQRARATLAERSAAGPPPSDAVSPEQQELLASFVDAFERYDVDRLVTLLHDDVQMSMPPYDLWLQGPAHVKGWLLGQGIGCKGSRLVPTTANGTAAFGSYRVDPAGGHVPWALFLIEVSGDRIVGYHSFLDNRLFDAFGLPAHLD
jgi:RNA polymerase sigma-70 factor (ECF subfamily)